MTRVALSSDDDLQSVAAADYLAQRDKRWQLWLPSAAILLAAGVTGTLIGLGLGPTIVGALSDNLAPWFGDQSLRYGLLSMVIPQLLASYCCWCAAKTIGRDFID